mmetsp:Transcript_30241/g.46238  ORF Transcript_30241/g.46238 Transcript_30241/m.46238 type:complete len:92 (-) Transcript_30241:773-1048(-)
MFERFGIDKIFSDLAAMHAEGNPEALIAASVKMQFLFKLMADLKREGHRMLIFSMSKQVLNLMEKILEAYPDYKYLRIDGDTEIASRESIC